MNDAFGHHVGDKLIVQVADVLLHQCRADDIIARTGGDEFVIILPKTDAASAETLVERIRVAVNNRKIMDITISISFGWDTKVSQTQSIRDILNNAENNMYKKKMFDSSSRRSAVVKSILQTLKIKSSYEDVHSERVSILCEAFGKELNLRTDEIAELKVSGELHDIGKIAIDEAVLSDPELSASGLAQIRSHPEIGYRLLSNTNEFYNIAEHILAHHERWDGTGYPKGLKEYEISYMAMIIAIVDSYDAMKSDRPYRKALDEAQIVLEIKENAGTQFDPQLARVFVEKVLCTIW